ncbi:hypothetical protein [Kitasatospora arboriphila]
MRRTLMDDLSRVREESLAVRREMSPGLPVRTLDTLLRAGW